MKKYKVGHYGKELIVPVEIVRETASSVFVINGYSKKEERRSKVTAYESYFDSWDEAWKHLLDKAQARCDATRRQMERAGDEYKRVELLRNKEAA